jgi:hypothetical protein
MLRSSCVRRGESVFRMRVKRPIRRPILLLLTAIFVPLCVRSNAASCTTQAQLTAAQRDTLAGSARTIVSQLQSGDIQGLRANTLPAIAADFNAIAASVQNLKPLIQRATITVDELYLLDASTNPPSPTHTDFYCGSPVVVVNFTSLPQGTYALVILHATGVPQPQQISVILSKSSANRWLLAGFFFKPMIAAGHDGLWYWTSARRYAQSKMNWDAWLYYRMATNLLEPLDFLSSPKLIKLQHESDEVRPQNLPGENPLTVNAFGSSYKLTAIETTTMFGALDLDVEYSPDPTEAAQMRDPVFARKQVTQVMSALMELHPELQQAFHGMWVRANQGSASLFALELPMDQIAAAPRPPNVSSSSPVH